MVLIAQELIDIATAKVKSKLRTIKSRGTLLVTKVREVNDDVSQMLEYLAEVSAEPPTDVLYNTISTLETRITPHIATLKTSVINVESVSDSMEALLP